MDPGTGTAKEGFIGRDGGKGGRHDLYDSHGDDSGHNGDNTEDTGSSYGTYDAYDDYKDGNALAGPLSEIFAVDITAAVSRCVNCDAQGPVAGLRVYGRAPALVARCPDCNGVVLRLVRTDDTAWLDLRGTVALSVPVL